MSYSGDDYSFRLNVHVYISLGSVLLILGFYYTATVVPRGAIIVSLRIATPLFCQDSIEI